MSDTAKQLRAVIHAAEKDPNPKGIVDIVENWDVEGFPFIELLKKAAEELEAKERG